MRQEWIEFEGKQHNKILLRPEYISSIIDESGTTGITRIGYDEHPILNGELCLTTLCECKEPYEQVKQKIMDAEKVDLSDAIVEHFTREEYAHILELFENATDVANACGRKASLLTATIMDKLYEILKEDK